MSDTNSNERLAGQLEHKARMAPGLSQQMRDYLRESARRLRMIGRDAEKGSRRHQVIQRLCEIREKAHAHVGYDYAADCVCGQGGMWGTDYYDDSRFRDDGVVQDWIEEAVDEKIARESAPDTKRDKCSVKLPGGPTVSFDVPADWNPRTSVDPLPEGDWVIVKRRRTSDE